MRIGIYFECQRKSGGAYQYALNLLEALKQNSEHQFVVFNLSTDFPFSEYKLLNWQIINLIPITNGQEKKDNATQKKFKLRRQINLSVIDFLRKFHLYKTEIFLTSLLAKKRARVFAGHNLDVIFFHSPSEMSFLTDIKTVVPIHDLHHRNHPEMKEVSGLGQFDKREYLFSNIRKHAYKIMVNSENVKKDVMKFYGAPEEKIEVIPVPAPSYIKHASEQEMEKTKKKYSLPDKFIFYPAQFWPHKNHKNLVTALKILKDQNFEVAAVLVGSKQELWGEFDRVQNLIKSLGLQKQVFYLGYVDNSEMSSLYGLAEALVMPTLFGYTYDVVEAWSVGCPVVYSNASDCREQVGNAALLVDSRNPTDIAEKIKTILTDEKLKQELIKNGRKKILFQMQEDLNKKIAEIIAKIDKTFK
jgi:glycosyltransferase involved in cell wall biosynthesis